MLHIGQGISVRHAFYHAGKERHIDNDACTASALRGRPYVTQVTIFRSLFRTTPRNAKDPYFQGSTVFSFTVSTWVPLGANCQVGDGSLTRTLLTS